jgi:hypothetical protein
VHGGELVVVDLTDVRTQRMYKRNGFKNATGVKHNEESGWEREGGGEDTCAVCGYGLGKRGRG